MLFLLHYVINQLGHGPHTQSIPGRPLQGQSIEACASETSAMLLL
jgi:hypothetical protein